MTHEKVWSLPQDSAPQLTLWSPPVSVAYDNYACFSVTVIESEVEIKQSKDNEEG